MTSDDIAKQINKKYGYTIVRKGSEIQNLNDKIQRVSTGSISLDFELQGGIPRRGQFAHIYGDFASGKTTLALMIAREFQKVGDQVVFIDIEKTFPPDWAENIGIDLEKLSIVSDLASAEEYLDVAVEYVTANDFGLIIIDSVAALTPLTEMTEDMDEMQMGLQARLMNKFLRRATAKQKKLWEAGTASTVILLNQLRDKLGGYGKQETAPGGRGISFASSLTIRLQKAALLALSDEKEDKRNFVAQTIDFFVEKSKISPPKRSGSFDLYFQKAHGMLPGQINVRKEAVVYGKLCGFIKQAGHFFELTNGVKLNSLANLLEYFRENPSEFDKLRSDIVEYRKSNKEV